MTIPTPEATKEKTQEQVILPIPMTMTKSTNGEEPVEEIFGLNYKVEQGTNIKQPTIMELWGKQNKRR
jgi:hypothetical protein